MEEVRYVLDGIHKRHLSFDDAVGDLIKFYKDAHPTEFKKEEKPNQKKSDGKLSLENIKVGDIIPDLHNEEIEITEDLIEQMRQYEQETNKSVIWRGKITGTFLFFKYVEDHPEEKLKTKNKPGRKPKKAEEDVNIEELEEKEIVNEEDMVLDCIADYKMEYGVKTVNTKSQKFKQFYYKWKQSD